MSKIITLNGKLLTSNGKAITVDGTTAEGNKLLWKEGTENVASKATATYIWPFPVRAYINTTNNYWGFYNDSSTSFCFSVDSGKRYTISWDTSYTSSLYRIAFVKEEDVPSYTNSNAYRVDVYDSSGIAGIEHNGFVQSYSFTVTDNSIKMCVIQVTGTTTIWTNGTIRSWFIELMSHFTIIIE